MIFRALVLGCHSATASSRRALAQPAADPSRSARRVLCERASIGFPVLRDDGRGSDPQVSKASAVRQGGRRLDACDSLHHMREQASCARARAPAARQSSLLFRSSVRYPTITFSSSSRERVKAVGPRPPLASAPSSCAARPSWLSRTIRLEPGRPTDRCATTATASLPAIRWDDPRARGARLNAQVAPRAFLYVRSRLERGGVPYQLFVREFDHNLPDCSNLCHEPSGVAMTEQIGSGKGTVTLDDFERCDAIFIFGQNPGTNHPRMLGELRAAAKRGCRIVAFNPLRERGLERFANPQSARDMLTGGSTAIAQPYIHARIGGASRRSPVHQVRVRTRCARSRLVARAHLRCRRAARSDRSQRVGCDRA